MKKIIVLILIFLPIFLMVSISFAGRIFSVISFINVESVVFVDEYDEPITSPFKIAVNSPITIKAKVYPERATNRNVTFSVSNSVALEHTADGNHLILTGRKVDIVSVTVTTVNMKKTCKLDVQITDELVNGISLNYTELELGKGSNFTLVATISPVTALNTKVTWHSSAPELVSVNKGVITALDETPADQPAEITVTTDDGHKTATCLVTVTNKIPMVMFNKPNDETNVYKLQQANINLLDLITYNSESVNINDISFKIISGSGVSGISIQNNILTIQSANPLHVITVRAYITNAPQYYSDISFVRLS